MPIYVLDTTRLCAAGWSRHSHFVRVPALDGDGLIERLVDLAKQLACRPVLILSCDQSVNTVSSYRQDL
ncbi:MAG TPA: hypothetical protein VEV20_09325, partial [Burkholderiales bacterium]|nr:hypothetical protein [Burkholderiales bacterium]